MSFALLFFSALTVCLIAILVWAFRSPAQTSPSAADLRIAEEVGRRHLTYFPQIQRAIVAEDFVFLESRGYGKLARRVRKERRLAALRYLACLQDEFMKLWRLARVVAGMSPRVAPMGEFERFRLGVAFNVRCELLRFRFALGLSAVPDFRALSLAASKLAIRMETAINDLGERAAMASEIASALDRSGLSRP